VSKKEQEKNVFLLFIKWLQYQSFYPELVLEGDDSANKMWKKLKGYPLLDFNFP